MSLLHVLLSCAISMFQLNIPVSGPASLLPNPLATFSLLSILQSSFLPTQPWVVQSQRGKKECKNSRESEGGGSSHALSYFLNDGDQSGGAGQREEGRIEVCEDRGRRVHGSPDHLALPPHWSGGPLASLMGVLSTRHGWPFSPAVFEATMTAVITTYVKTCHADFTPKLFGDMTVGR